MAVPAARSAIDASRRLDANQLNLFVTNLGSFGFDLFSGNAGLYYPRGTSRTALFAGGLWVGGFVAGELRVTAAEYGLEWAPGRILAPGAPENPNHPDLVVWKVAPWTGDSQDTAHVERVPDPSASEDGLVHHGWGEYMAKAVPGGAPWRVWRLPDTGTPDPSDSVDVPGPAVRGDLMTWAVYNDADPTFHTTFGTDPIGLEVRQTLWALAGPAALERSVFIEYEIVHRGVQPLDQAYVSLWSDPDLGGINDDLVGFDVPRSLGYAYNANNADAQYGATPPAVGFELLQGPIDALGDTLPLGSFNKYINGTDPQFADQAYAYMQGLLPDGSPVVDPTTGLPTTFFHPGDPVTGEGWLDAFASDRRMMMSAGPFAMAPGDTQRVRWVLRIGQGANRLASIVDLRAGAAVNPDDPDSCTTALVNCPRPPEYWRDEMALAGGGQLSLDELERLAVAIDSASVAIDWPDGGEVAAMAALFDGPPADMREVALRAHATLLANLLASANAISENDGDCIFLDGGTTVTCDGTTKTLAALALPFDSDPALAASYLNLDATHRRPFAGVDIGLESFGGGAGYGSSFFGSALDPYALPDSFPDVELRFDATQKAYRFLRLETELGGAPVNGREYRYGGMHDVPFQVWDVTHGVQLDVAFVERAMADFDGTLLPPGSQPATFDSTWRLPPDDPVTGGREYLMVFSRGYGETPKPELAVDGSVASGLAPVVYALWVALRNPGDVIDPADRFLFDQAYASLGSVDERLVLLAGAPQDDPAVVAEYQSLAACELPPSRGEGIGLTCASVVAALASLVESSVADGRATIRWYVPLEHAGDVERREGDGDWIAVAPLVRDGAGFVTYVDEGLSDGVRYGYRLSILTAAGRQPVAETSLTPGSALRLGLAGFVPNPAGRDAVIAFTLPSTGAAQLELFDVAGRRVLAREVGSLGPGNHRIALDPRLPAGIYLLRLTRDGATVTAKSVRMD